MGEMVRDEMPDEGAFGRHAFEPASKMMRRAGRQMAGSGWFAFKANDAHRVRAVHELPLFSTLGSLALMLMAFAAMWYREGR